MKTDILPNTQVLFTIDQMFWEDSIMTEESCKSYS